MTMTNDRVGHHAVVLGGALLHDAFPLNAYVLLGYESRLFAPSGDAVVDAAAHHLPADHNARC
jgi:hypothetical protein